MRISIIEDTNIVLLIIVDLPIYISILFGYVKRNRDTDIILRILADRTIYMLVDSVSK